MITSIKLDKVATYTNEVKIDDLKKVNFFFGNNGAGKSTIAKFLYDLSLNEEKISIQFKNCSQIGYDNHNQEILVFDEKFIQRNFINKNLQNGIFSLNQANREIDELIENENLKLKQNENYLNNILKDRKNKIYLDNREYIEDSKSFCFEERKKTLNSFIKIRDKFPFKQTQNNYDKIISIINNNPDLTEITFENLLNNYNKLYEIDHFEIKSNISPNIYKKIRKIELKLSSILNEIIIGNDDVDIAKMINDLGISNWVEGGLNILKMDLSNTKCPFCQNESINENLLNKFEKYFDENYKAKISQILTLKADYELAFNDLLLEIKNLTKEFNSKNIASDLFEDLKLLFEKNIRIIDQKIKFSNEKKEIFSIYNFKNNISKIIFEIKNHNEDFSNIEKNKEIFLEDIWNYLAYNCKPQIELTLLISNEFAIDYFFELQIEEYLNDKISDSREKIEIWKEETITTQEAVKNINTILRNSGFEGFVIDEKEKVNNISQYFLRRIDSQNNENVFKSLSEGEKNFIAFLYFFQLCLGTDNVLKSSKKKIIVIDDPVSSLDSQILFIVTTLIHQLIAKKGKKPNNLELRNNNIEQVFILSHNIYFYKEVSLNHRPICEDKNFYHVSKIKNVSEIKCHGNKNNILNDYSLLWKTLNNFKGTNDTNLNIAICNIMRRILESYINFTNLGSGNSTWDCLINISLDNPKYYICSALISEINEGSHKVSPLDDIFFQRLVNEVPQNLFEAFELIFKEIGEEHYNVMIKID
ncbi:wobble nucleotide-excising tRNase [Flavobacterium aquaticum]|uniref:Wobble nucleotide-excising tRNase n=1 Tax=Flavobacterium aquaticum TaxID=1236486 RepID=A0A327Z4I9_9FLAO|nr:AAA family ATPase [Flavobacterium aquaticum]RAK25299.1 wobble nucleotide-excising tRNase [Flavobacterium aquaticum]